MPKKSRKPKPKPEPRVATGQRRYILVQSPDPLPEPKQLAPNQYGEARTLTTIADVTRERVRRSAQQIRQQAERDNIDISGVDLGFRSLKYVFTSTMELTTPDGLLTPGMVLDPGPVKRNQPPENVLFELMLRLGWDIGGTVDQLTIAGSPVWCSTNRDGKILLFSMAPLIDAAIARQMLGLCPALLIVRRSALSQALEAEMRRDIAGLSVSGEIEETVLLCCEEAA